MSNYLSKEDTYYIGRNSIIWNPKNLSYLESENKKGVPRCPESWDVKKYGPAPMFYYGIYIKRCPKSSCEEPDDYKYELLPGSTKDNGCKHLNKWWDDVIVGYCTPESAEKAYFGETTSFTHAGGPLSIYLCGNLAGTIVYGITYDGWDPENPIEIGNPIENYLGGGVQYSLQVFADDSETCGTLGVGGNWGEDPSRPGWFFVETDDPFDLKCPGFAGHPDLYGTDHSNPNFALPKYTVSGGSVKYEYEKDGLGSPEYELPSDDYVLVWTTTPPERPEFAEWPPRHTDRGAWVCEVPVNYYNLPGSWLDPVVKSWILELVFNRQDGVWMIILYDPNGKDVKGNGRSLWFDVFVNPSTIGPCGLSLANSDQRDFIPLRNDNMLFLDGEFQIQIEDYDV